MVLGITLPSFSEYLFTLFVIIYFIIENLETIEKYKEEYNKGTNQS
jgi:hypothetical protein